MREILLTQNQIALVDDEDFEYLNQFKWHVQWSRKTKSFYAVRKGPNNTRILMHRLIMNTPKNLLCDHKNHATLDNQKHNLRNVTHSQNNMNTGARANNLLGEKNISRYGKSRFEVRIKVNKEYVFDKTYDTLDEAITARDKALEEFHGEYRYSV